jgi:GAF domain-containing protein
VRSAIAYPHVKQGRFVAAVFMYEGDPRGWSEGDVSLVGEVGKRTWEAVERARAKAALPVERNRVRQVLDLLPEAVVVTDTALTIQFSNRAVREILGLDAAELAAHVDTGQHVPADDAEAFAAYGARRLDRTPTAPMSCRSGTHTGPASVGGWPAPGGSMASGGR